MKRLMLVLTLAQSFPTGGASLSGIVIRSGTEGPLAGAQAILTVVTPTPATGTSASVLTGAADSLPSVERNFSAEWNLKAFPSTFRNRRETTSH